MWYENDVRAGGEPSIVNLSGAGGNLETMQPLPTGAAKIVTGFDNTDKAEVGVEDNYGRHDDIFSTLIVTYSYHKATNPGQNLFAAPALKLTFFNPMCDDPASLGDCFTSLIYEPTWNGLGSQSSDVGTPTSTKPAVDTWTTVTVDENTGLFWSKGGFGIGDGRGGPPLRTLAEWRAALSSDFGDAVLFRVSVSVGSSNQGQIGYFDHVSISHNFNGGFDASYNFEPSPDHFLSYSLSGGDDDDSSSDSGSGGSSLKVDLMDQFGTGTFKVKEAVALYNPADKNGEGVTDEKTRLVGYKITPSGDDDGSSDDDSGGGSSRFSVRIDNQFGALYLDTRNADRLLVPSLKDLDNPIPDEDLPATFSVDHFKCYRVARTSGKPRFKRRQVTVDDQFTNGAKKFDVRKPSRLCNPVEKKKGDEITPIQNPDLHLLCYEVKVAKDEPKHKKVKDLYVNNQFGPLQFDTKKEKELCVPSQKTVVGSPSDGDDDSS